MGGFQVFQELLQGLGDAVELGDASRVDELSHLVLLQSESRQDVQQVLLVVVGDVPQVRGQPVQLRVAFPLLRLSPVATEPFANDGGIREVFEGFGERLLVHHRFHRFTRIIFFFMAAGTSPSPLHKGDFIGVSPFFISLVILTIP